MTKSMPTARQILGAKIRATEEAYIKKHRKPCGGGWSIPTSKDRYEYLAKKFEMTPHEISFFFTYSRYCTHPWSAGACSQCPE